MSNTRTFHRRTQREFAAMVRRLRSGGALGGASDLRPLHKIGGTRSPYYRPAPWGDRRKEPQKVRGFKGGKVLTKQAIVDAARNLVRRGWA